MCGIAGIISRKQINNTTDILNKMISVQKHRGPDSNGKKILLHNNWEIGLGHTRLSIIDLSHNANQPMTDTRTLNTICYNGEVYNYSRLRSEIQEESEWKSNSDTEVILKGYNQWGIECLQKIRGMFAFSIWDNQRKTLILARDQFGIKPLYFYYKENQFIYSSEIRSLLSSELIPRRLSEQGLESYLEFGSVISPNTIIEDIYSLMPGEYLEIKLGDSLDIRKESFRDKKTSKEKEIILKTYSETSKDLFNILRDSVSSHLMSDVPLGVFLSGGIDSSTIVALMHETSKKPINTFSVVFEQKKYTENIFAKQIARKYRTNHSEILLSENEILKMTPEALDSMDQPTMDGVNTYVISKAVKKAGITVALSGLGADELFAGYSSFSRISKLKYLKYIPKISKKLLYKLAHLLFENSSNKMKAFEFLESNPNIYSLYKISRQLLNSNDRQGLLPSIKQSGTSYIIEGYANENDFDQVNLMSELEMHGYMTNTLLRDTDFMSMSNSLEVRVPFVDKEVYNFASQIPGKWKIKDRRLKSILIDSMSNLIPDEIKNRKKMGFTLPFDQWLRTSLRKNVDEVLIGAKEKQEKLGLSPEKISEIWSSYLSSSNDSFWSRPWALFVLIHWCDKNGVEYNC